MGAEGNAKDLLARITRMGTVKGHLVSSEIKNRFLMTGFRREAERPGKGAADTQPPLVVTVSIRVSGPAGPVPKVFFTHMCFERKGVKFGQRPHTVGQFLLPGAGATSHENRLGRSS